MSSNNSEMATGIDIMTDEPLNTDELVDDYTEPVELMKAKAEQETVEKVSEEQPYDVHSLTDFQKDIILTASLPGSTSLHGIANEVGTTAGHVRYTLAQFLDLDEIPIGVAFDRRILSFRDRKYADLTAKQQRIVRAVACDTEFTENEVARFADASQSYVHEVRVVYNHVVESEARRLSFRSSDYSDHVRHVLGEMDRDELLQEVRAEAEARVPDESGFAENVLELLEECDL